MQNRGSLCVTEFWADKTKKSVIRKKTKYLIY